MIEIVLTLDGVMCEKCESRVNEAVKHDPKVKSVKTSHVTGECTVVCADDIDRDRIISAIEAEGVKVIGTIEKSCERKGFFAKLFGK